MSKSLFTIKIYQMFCNHRWTIKEWYPLDKEGEKLFKDTGLFSSCEKCGKFRILSPTIPSKVEEKYPGQIFKNTELKNPKKKVKCYNCNNKTDLIKDKKYPLKYNCKLCGHEYSEVSLK